MDKQYQHLKRIVEQEMHGVDSAHDMRHVDRVYALCRTLIQDRSDVNLNVLIPAVLLHDIARIQEDRDQSRTKDHAILSAAQAGKILHELGYASETIEHIQECIRTHRYRSHSKPTTIEAQILYDADKLDVLGAIGIARSFMIAGQYRERVYSTTPLKDYVQENLVDGRLNGRIKDITKHAPNLEFETKFKRIPDTLFTSQAQQIAQQRMEYMKSFFDRLKQEIIGEL